MVLPASGNWGDLCGHLDGDLSNGAEHQYTAAHPIHDNGITLEFPVLFLEALNGSELWV